MASSSAAWIYERFYLIHAFKVFLTRPQTRPSRLPAGRHSNSQGAQRRGEKRRELPRAGAHRAEAGTRPRAIDEQLPRRAVLFPSEQAFPASAAARLPRPSASPGSARLVGRQEAEVGRREAGPCLVGCHFGRWRRRRRERRCRKEGTRGAGQAERLEPGDGAAQQAAGPGRGR